MHVVEPKVFILGDMGLGDETRDFLDAIGAVDWHPGTNVESDNEYLIEIAGRSCYKSFGTELNKNLTRVRNDHVAYIGNILDTGHGSVLEHATTSIALVGVSRILTHELVRHRAGCAYSQESMRFVRMDDMGMFIPSCIKSDPRALALFTQAVEAAEEYYNRLVAHMIRDDMPFSKKKEITSAIRRIAPSGHSTNIVMTANHRAWRHLIQLRTAPGVEEEIGMTFAEIAERFHSKYPALYQDMHQTTMADQAWPTITFDNNKV